MDLSIVVPCYNEEESLREMHRRVSQACKNAPIRTYEIIFVNDGSKDNTAGVMNQLLKEDKNLIVIDLSRNHGQQLALTAGLTESKGDYVLILDADLQDPPELLTPMLQQAQAGADVVYGKREARAGETWIKLLTSSLFYRLLSWLSDISIPNDVGDFRLMSRCVVDEFLKMPEQHRFVRGMISWVGFKQEPFPFVRDARYAGVTKYPLLKLLQFAVEAITSFSIKPLRISILFAMLGAALAALLGFYVIYVYFFHNIINGWASLACIMTFFSSLQLVCIGLIGEYIGRTYIEVKNRPLFIVRAIHRGIDKAT